MAPRDSSKGLNKNQYARHRAQLGLVGATHQAVTAALDKGRIHLNEHGKIDPEVADREWEQNTATGNRTFAQREATRNDDDADIPEIAVSDARIKAMKAIKEELDIQQLQGELVRAEDISKELYEVMVSLKQNIMNIPVRLAPVVAPLTDLTDIEVAIENELISALNSMSEHMSRSRTLSS